MAIRYYLIPFETDTTKTSLRSGCAPKYLDLFNGTAQGLIPKETTVDRLNRTWLRNFYIVKIDSKDFTELDKQPDVIHLTKQKILNNISKLKALGVDTTGLSINTTSQQIEKRIRQWLTQEDKDFSKL